MATEQSEGFVVSQLHNPLKTSLFIHPSVRYSNVISIWGQEARCTAVPFCLKHVALLCLFALTPESVDKKGVVNTNAK